MKNRGVVLAVLTLIILPLYSAEFFQADSRTRTKKAESRHSLKTVRGSESAHFQFASAEQSEKIFEKKARPGTHFNYSVPKASFVSLTIYDLLGRRVRKLSNEYQAPGVYSGLWDGRDDAKRHVPCGAYMLSIKAGVSITRRTVMLVR